TALRTDTGTLKFVAWRVGTNGTITRDEDFDQQGETISLLRFAPLVATPDLYLTAVRGDDDRLRLYTWRFADEPKAETPSDNIVLYGSNMFENTAQVIPPRPSLAPNGKIVVNLGQSRATAGLVHRDLVVGLGAIAASAVATRIPYPLGANQTT